MNGSTKTYQVDYLIRVQDQAGSAFAAIAEQANKLSVELNTVRENVKTIVDSFKAIKTNPITLEAKLDESYKAQLKTLESAAQTSANNIARMFQNAFSGKAAKSSASTKESLTSEIKSLQQQLQVANAKEAKLLKNRISSLKEERRSIRSTSSQASNMQKTAAAIGSVGDNHKSLTKVASSLKSINTALSKFQRPKNTKIKIDADISPAVTKLNTLLESIRSATAAIPVTLTDKNKSKGGKAVSDKTGKLTKVGVSNASIASKSSVKNVQKAINDKKQIVETKAHFAGGELVNQTNASLNNIQRLVNSRAITLRARFATGDTAFQLNQSLANLQRLVNERPLVLKVRFDGESLAFQINQLLANLQRLLGEHPLMLNASASTTATSSNVGSRTVSRSSSTKAYEKHMEDMEKIALNSKLFKGREYGLQNRAYLQSRQADLEAAFGSSEKDEIIARNEAKKRGERIARNIRANNAAQSERLRANTAQPIMMPIGGGGSGRNGGFNRGSVNTTYRTAAQPNIYARARTFWYPFTGNTSFGARTPMAVEMAKGMGSMMAIGGAMSAVGSSIGQAVSYQNIMKTTQAILANGTDNYSLDSFKNMEKIVRKVGKDTKFTAPQVASAARFLAMAGYDIPSINHAINPVADIALIGDTNLGETADKLTNVMTTFGIAPEKMRDIADIMTSTFTRSNTDMMMLAESAKYAGGIAHLYGGSFQNNFSDVMAMFGALGNAGIQASSAGTTLRMMYQNLMQPNKKQKKTLEHYGIKTRGADGLPLEMIEILKQIKNSVPSNQLADAIGNMFRITAQPGAAALVNSIQKDGGGSLIRLMEANRAAVGTGVSGKIANEKKNTVSGLWAQVQSTFTEGILQAFENREGGWAGKLMQLRDYLAKPETIKMLSSIVDLVEKLASYIAKFANIWATAYNIMPGFINTWMQAQLIFTQIGYLATPIVQLIGILTSLKTVMLGNAAAATMITTAERARGSAMRTQAISSAIANGAATSRYGAYISSGAAAVAYGKYNANMGYWMSKERSMRNLANSYHATAKPGVYGMYNAPLWLHTKDYAKGERAAVLASKAEQRVASTKAAYFNELRAIRRPEQLSNRALMARYAAMGGDAALIAQAGAGFAARDKAIADATSARHATRVVGTEVRNRAASIYKYRGFQAAMSSGFSAGRAMGTLGIVSMVGSLKNMVLSLFSGIARAIGLLVSPAGLAVTAIAAVGLAIWKFYSNAKEHKKQLDLLQKNSQWIEESNGKLKSNYLEASVSAGGFKPIQIGYEKPNESEKKNYSLEGNPVVSAILNGDTDKLTDREFVSTYLPNSIYATGHTKYTRNFLTSASGTSVNRNPGTWSEIKEYWSDLWNHSEEATSLSDEKEKLAIAAQWGNLAVQQDGVKQSMADLQAALYSKDITKAQKIVEAYRPTSTTYMSDLANAEDINKISDPTKFYEWQYAQYAVLKDMLSNYVGPSQHYSHAMDLLKEFKELNPKERNGYDITQLGQQLIQSIPIVFNGTTAGLTLDKMGRIDWNALAQSVNNGIPLSIAQQQEILASTYDAIYNDPNIKNFASVIELLNTYLPQIANARNPYNEGRWTSWGEETEYDKADNGKLSSYIAKPGEPFNWSAFMENGALKIGMPRYIDYYKEELKKNNGNIIMADASLHQNRPELFPESITSNTPKANASTYNRGGKNGNVFGSDDDKKKGQKDYASSYNRNAARPTQVVINIDKLANFDRTAIAKDADERSIAAAIETKIAEAVMMLSSTALNSASTLISQGV